MEDEPGSLTDPEGGQLRRLMMHQHGRPVSAEADSSLGVTFADIARKLVEAVAVGADCKEPADDLPML